MSSDKYKKIGNDPDEEGETGFGGAGGQIEYRDFISGPKQRDDMLPPDEMRRLLNIHKVINEALVKKQKTLIDQTNSLKEGKMSLQSYRQGTMGSGMNAQYAFHPLLANKAQFSGIDRQVNALPNENVAETNNDKREELQYQFQLQHTPEQTYKKEFNPQPNPYKK